VVGFIGLGNMGLPMAVNLAKQTKKNAAAESEKEAGGMHQRSDNIRVLAYDLNPDSCRKARDESDDNVNIDIASSLEEIALADNCGTVFTMLPGCDAVNATMSTLLQYTPEQAQGKVLVDCSTVAPSTSRRWHEAWSSRKGHHAFLDAPVSGGVKGAQEASLTFMVGCGTSHSHEIEAYDQAVPLLHKMGRKVIACGGPGTGSATKLCNNLALATQMIGICEAMNLGEALDVDPVVLADVMNQSTAGCWSCSANNPHPKVALAHYHEKHGRSGGCSGSTSGTPAPPADAGPPASRHYRGGFASNLMLKDLGLALDAASKTGISVPLTGSALQLYQLAKSHGFGDKDFGVMLQLLKGNSNQRAGHGDDDWTVS